MKDYLYKTYDTLHSMPELGYQEVKTSAYIARELKSMGYDVTEKVGTTGIVAVMDSGIPGKSLGFRADMDALPFEVDGEQVAIHACGHDANSAMLLTTAKEVAKTGIKSGKLTLVFQQAEEMVGAIEMANTEIMKSVYTLIGTHLRPKAEAVLGEAISALQSGASYFLSFEVQGKLSHGARAHLGVNAVEVAVQIINAINCIKEDVTIPHSVKVTQINSIGNSKNTVPDRCRVVFDIRSQDNTVADSIIHKCKAIIDSTCQATGASFIDLKVHGVPAAEIDPELFELCDQAIVNILGKSKGNVCTVGGEDIHYFKRINGTKIGYIGLGADMEGNLHSPEMTFDKKALTTGVQIQLDIINQSLGLK